MLTAAIATTDATSSAQLRAALQQTGLVQSVKEWTVSSAKLPDLAEAIPDVVLLDLSRDPEIYFSLAGHLRRIMPSVRLIACSPVSEPNSQTLLEAMRCGVQDFLSKPIDAKVLQETLSRFLQEHRPAEKRGQEKLIVVMGAKGGVGCTTLAVNLGVQLSNFARKHTLLLDLAHPLGMAHLMLDLHPRFGVRDAVENLDRLDGHFFGGLLTRHKTGLEILGGATHPEEWQRIPVASLERVVNVAQAGFDTVLIDYGAQFSSDWSPVLRLARMILLTAESNVPALWTLERRLSALTGLGVESERVRIVINRWRRGDEDALKSVEKTIKRPIFFCMPNDFRQVSTAVNLGTPLTANHNNPLVTRYRELAGQLSGIEPVRAVKKHSLTSLFPFSGKRVTT